MARSSAYRQRRSANLNRCGAHLLRSTLRDPPVISLCNNDSGRSRRFGWAALVLSSPSAKGSATSRTRLKNGWSLLRCPLVNDDGPT
ncbi:hypothetical protein AAC387_Pa09g1390 [Persea americana]